MPSGSKIIIGQTGIGHSEVVLLHHFGQKCKVMQYRWWLVFVTQNWLDFFCLHGFLWSILFLSFWRKENEHRVQWCISLSTRALIRWSSMYNKQSNLRGGVSIEITMVHLCSKKSLWGWKHYKSFQRHRWPQTKRYKRKRTVPLSGCLLCSEF